MSIARSILFSILFLSTAMNSSFAQSIYPIDPNPVVIDGGKQITDFRYNPFSGQYEVDTHKSSLRRSYFDRNRNVADQGSIRRVNEYQTDENGVRWHVTGTRWTSNGVPHGDLTRTRVTRSGIIDHKESEYVGFSAPAPTKPSTRNAVWPGQTKPQSTPQREGIWHQPTPHKPTSQNRGGNPEMWRNGRVLPGTTPQRRSPVNRGFNVPNRGLGGIWGG